MGYMGYLSVFIMGEQSGVDWFRKSQNIVIWVTSLRVFKPIGLTWFLNTVLKDLKGTPNRRHIIICIARLNSRLSHSLHPKEM